MPSPDERSVARLRLATSFDAIAEAAHACGLDGALSDPAVDALPKADARTKRALEHVRTSVDDASLAAFLRNGDRVLGPLLTVSQLRVLRREIGRYLLKTLKPATPAGRFPKDLAAWAEKNDVTDVLAEELPGAGVLRSVQRLEDTNTNELPTSQEWMRLRMELIGWTVGRFLTDRGGRLDAHQTWMFTWLEHLAETRRRAAAEEKELAYATRPLPEDETARKLVERLRRVRAALRETVRPRLREHVVVVGARLTDENPPRFAYEEVPAGGSKWVSRGNGVTIPISLDDNVDIRPICGACAKPCVHALGAVDHLLGILFGVEGNVPASTILEAARTPTWQRFIDELDRAIDTLDQPKAGDAVVWWNIDLEALRATPYVQHRGKRGALLKAKRASADALKALVLEDRDERIVLRHALLRAASRRGHREEQAALAELVRDLIGHPHVFLGTEPVNWKLEDTPIGLVAVEADGGVEVRIALGDETLTPEAWSDLLARHLYGEETLIIPRGDERRVLVTHLDARMTTFLERWKSHAATIPVEAQSALVERLSRVAPHVPVRASHVVETTEVPPAVDPTFVITPLPNDVGLMIEVRTRPLEHGPLMVPGAGPDELTASTPERNIVHTERDRYEEIQAANAVLDSLEEEAVTRDGFTMHVDGLDRSLELVERLREIAPCVWPDRTWRSPTVITADALRLRVNRRRDWFDVEGFADVHGRRVELAVLLDAAREHRRYVRLGDGEFLALEQSLYDRMLDLAGHTSRTKHGIELTAAASGPVDALGQEAAEYETPETFVSLVDRIRAAGALDPKPPASLDEVLRPYQRDGHAWMTRLAAWGAGAVLADDMGLGKTLQAIAVLLDRKSGPALVVAPTSVCFNWQRELERFAPSLNAKPYAGPDREVMLPSVGAGDVLIASYAVAARDATLLEKVGFETLVLDEAQAIKNAGTKRSKAIRKLDAGFKIALTGTPVENHPGELWAIFAAVFPGLLGSWERFQRELMEQDGRGTAIATAALSRVVRPYILRRTKDEVAQDLPPRTEIVVDVELSKRERELYDDARLAAISQLKEAKSDDRRGRSYVKVLAHLTRLRQLACHPALVDDETSVPSSKLDRLLEIVHELVAEGRRALVFSQFTQHLGLVRDALDESSIPYLYLDGSTPAKQRPALVDAFQSSDTPLFLISLKAGGTGLNLTGADTVVHLDPWWNPAVEDQATDRAHRIGQTKPVTVYRLVSRGTVEEQIVELHEDKRRMVADLLAGATENARLSTEELAALIMDTAE